MTRLSNLKTSITNLWDTFGRSNTIGVAIIINLATITLGLITYYALSTPLNYTGLFLAFLGAWPIAKYALWGET